MNEASPRDDKRKKIMKTKKTVKCCIINAKTAPKSRNNMITNYGNCAS